MTILAECPLVWLLLIRLNKLSNFVVDHPLHILNTSKRSALFHLSFNVHRPMISLFIRQLLHARNYTGEPMLDTFQ